jgi:exonuclease III
MNHNEPQVLSWNLRGLNSVARCLTVHETIAATPCQIACLQETKLQSIDTALATFLAVYRLNNFAFKPVVGTKGGILLLWNDSEVDLTNIRLGRYSLSADAIIRRCMTTFTIIIWTFEKR